MKKIIFFTQYYFFRKKFEEKYEIKKVSMNSIMKGYFEGIEIVNKEKRKVVYREGRYSPDLGEIEIEPYDVFFSKNV